MRNKIVIVVVILVLAAAGGLAAFWPFGNGKVLRLPGVVEIQEVRLGSKVGGRVEALLIQEGDKIAYAGQRLLIFEAPELNNQKKQTQARLDSAIAELERAVNGPRKEEIDAAEAAMNSAWARWERAENGFRPEEIKQVKADLEAAEADCEQAKKEWKRVTSLDKENAVSRTEYDAALAARDRTKGRVDAARAKELMMRIGARQEDKDEAWQEYKRAYAQHKLLRKGTRPEDIEIAKAKVNELKANLEAIEINLAETTIIVPPNLLQPDGRKETKDRWKAVVEVIAVRPGDLVQANQPVIRVLRTQDLWVKVYVPETQYGLVTLHKKVGVTIDSYPGKVFPGEVIQRSNISEFTPRNVQSVDERRHQVFGVKILVDDPDGVFNAGMAAEVTIPLD
jgi:multidrug efflux pump subunit AcrA (membrane-fusion protein)